jgi:hypothetical protein
MGIEVHAWCMRQVYVHVQRFRRGYALENPENGGGGAHVVTHPHVNQRVQDGLQRLRPVRMQHRVVFGTLDAVQQVLATHGWHINTALIERLNLAIYEHIAATERRVITLCKHEDGLRQQLALYQTYYNFCLPHASLCQFLPQPESSERTSEGLLTLHSYTT